MSDSICFRVDDRLAVGYDDLNVIIFVKRKSPGHALMFDGDAWDARFFVHRDKDVLVRALREKGAVGPENGVHIREMPSDVREWRETKKASTRPSKRLSAAS